MGETWRFIHSGTSDPGWNMALDEAMICLHSEGKIPPTIRFYGWQPATLSVGYFQPVAQEIDMEAVRRHGLGFVRRLTGGRAVLHDRELTYSVVVSEAHPLMPRSVTEAYRVISTGLLLGFRNLGLDAAFSTPRSQEEKQSLIHPRSANCFDASSWYELIVEGRKVAGSAQTRQKGVILQHGSILMDIDTEKLFDLFLFKNERIKKRMQKSFASKAVSIDQLRPRKSTWDELQKAFQKGFAEGLNIRLEEADLTAEELELTDRLAREKYRNDAWNFRK
jgi:lipoyl(octanoyl) transferase